MNKINFVGFISVDHANPNGNPLDDNKPRVDDQSFGEISQFCIRRKVRNRLMAVGQPIFVQSDSNRLDGYETLSARLSGELDLSKYTNPRQLAEAAADKWLDVRAFGQPLEFKGKTNNSSAHVRGAISIGPAFSVDPVCIERVEIPKGLNNSRYLVQYGLYRFFGGIDVDLAEKNHLSEDEEEDLFNWIQENDEILMSGEDEEDELDENDEDEDEEDEDEDEEDEEDDSEDTF